MERKFFKLKPLSHFILITMTAAPLISFGAKAPVNTNPPVPYNYSILTPKVWAPRVTLNGQYGNYSFGQIDMLYPFLSQGEGMLYVDLRATATAQDAQEYNLGLGYRRIMNTNNPFILGGYLWADRRHSRWGDYFNQATLGAEYLGTQYDFRLNGYIPYGDRSDVVNETLNPYIANYTIGYTRDQQIQEALHGLDIEAGKVDLFDRRLRVYGDYYHFGFGSDDTRMNGGRARLEYIVENRWLTGMNSNLILTASYQYDNVRHSVGFAGFRLNIGKDYKPLDPLVGRMEEYIVRDDDIVIVKHNESTLFTDPNRYIFVDNTVATSGDGTFEHPFKTESAAENFSRSGDTIYTFSGSGFYPLPTGGLNLKSNQTFLGAGTDLTFSNIIVLPATTAPILNGRINVASDDTLTGFTLSGKGTNERVGIYGNQVQNVELYDLTVQDFTGANANGKNASSQSDYVYADPGKNGKSITGIHFKNSDDVHLTNVIVKNLAGGSANGGDASVTNISSYYTSTSRGGYGGYGGDATGIVMDDVTDLHLNQVTVTHIQGGAANGGNAKLDVQDTLPFDDIAIGGMGGRGGRAFGIELNHSNGNLTNIKIDNIHGGSSNGGDGQATGNVYAYARAVGGDGYVGGITAGLVSSKSNLNMTDVSISHVQGGIANGGDARNSSSAYETDARSGEGGFGGRTFGLAIEDGTVVASSIHITQIKGGSTTAGYALADGDSLNNFARGNYSGLGSEASGIYTTGHLTLTNATISDISGGFAQSGNARALNGEYNTAVGRAVNFISSRNAFGIDSTSDMALTNVVITNINGGAALGGDGIATGSNGSENEGSGGGFFGHQGTATGIRIGSSNTTLTNITIGEIHGASSIGGDAIGNISAFGGIAQFGGNAIGIDKDSHTVNTQSVTFDTPTITGGVAIGGKPQVFPGTPGTAQNIKP